MSVPYCQVLHRLGDASVQGTTAQQAQTHERGTNSAEKVPWNVVTKELNFQRLMKVHALLVAGVVLWGNGKRQRRNGRS